MPFWGGETTEEDMSNSWEDIATQHLDFKCTRSANCLRSFAYVCVFETFRMVRVYTCKFAMTSISSKYRQRTRWKYADQRGHPSCHEADYCGLGHRSRSREIAETRRHAGGLPWISTCHGDGSKSDTTPSKKRSLTRVLTHTQIFQLNVPIRPIPPV